ncbi:MAG: hypothetical protein ABFS14_08045 [Gemmatimonadota bacterium]
MPMDPLLPMNPLVPMNAVAHGPAVGPLVSANRLMAMHRPVSANPMLTPRSLNVVASCLPAPILTVALRASQRPCPIYTYIAAPGGASIGLGRDLSR